MGNRLRFFLAQGILAFSPAVLVLLVTRGDAAAGGELSVALGVIGAVYSIAYLGQRGFVSVRGFDVVPGRAGITLRLAATLLAAGPALWLALARGLALELGLFVVALKLSEGIVDLWVGMRIRLSPDERSSRAFLAVSIVRTTLVLAPVALLGAAVVSEPWMAGWLLLLFVLGYGAAHRDTARLGLAGSYAVSPRDALRYAWIMRAFAGATLVCAVLSALPRILLPTAEPASWAVPAVALSIVPIVGLAVQALWLGNVRRLSEEPRLAPRFVAEVLGVLALTGALWPAWRLVARLAYGFEAEADAARFATTVVAGAALVAGIGLSNLCKLTDRPRMEAFSYGVGIATLALCVYGLRTSMVLALATAPVAMALFLLVTIRGRVGSGVHGAEDALPNGG